MSANIRKRSLSNNVTLIEGSDFSFVFYGGKVLSHFAFADEGPDDFVRLVGVCRFSAVIMDLDIATDEPQDSVRRTKLRIKDEAEKDSDHRLAIFTKGREIENDIDISVFQRAVASLLKIEGLKLSGLQLSGKKRYVDEIVDHLGLQDDAAKTARRKLQDKVGLAELVIGEWTSDAEVPAYVDELLALMGRSRLA